MINRIRHGWLTLTLGLLTAARARGEVPCDLVLGEPDAVYSTTRVLRLGLMVGNPGGQPVEGGRLWVALPARQTATLRCLRVEASSPAAVEVDALGNQVLAAALPMLPGFARKSISITCTLASAGQPQPVALVTAEAFLGAEPYTEATAAPIVDLSKKLHGGTALDTARRADEWIRANVADSGYTARDRGALACLSTKKGDCTEMAYLFAALCRANRIPARLVGGGYVTANAVLRPTDYHNWAEFHDGTTWRVADPQGRRFLTDESCYVAMRIWGGTEPNPLGECHRFRVEPEGLRVRWNAD